jgi:hypothetical protein
MLIIGIDPDTKLSGIAAYEPGTKYFHVQKMAFFQLYEYLKENGEHIALVRIEGGWLNEKSNFHYGRNQSKAAGERIAKNVGANHETGRKIGEMCEHLGIEYEIVRPLGTKEIEHWIFKRITGFSGRTNQDMRDAGMLVYGYSLKGFNDLKVLNNHCSTRPAVNKKINN